MTKKISGKIFVGGKVTKFPLGEENYPWRKIFLNEFFPDKVFHMHAIFEALHIRAAILYQCQINGNAVKHNFIILFQKTVLDPIGKFKLIFDWELAVKRPIKTLDYTLYPLQYRHALFKIQLTPEDMALVPEKSSFLYTYTFFNIIKMCLFTYFTFRFL